MGIFSSCLFDIGITDLLIGLLNCLLFMFDTVLNVLLKVVLLVHREIKRLMILQIRKGIITRIVLVQETLKAFLIHQVKITLSI